ncbi:MAG: ABC transporter ATP-binding protein [Nevskiales bacterium]|nr:ABC transporter ATP-binding protein [Nevskiales bacterium]
MSDPLLSVQRLYVGFPGESERRYAVEDVSFELPAGGTLGVIGESGSGKSQTMLAILGLTPRQATVEGSIRFEGRELTGLSERALNRVRGAGIGCVFQNPMSSLNPYLRIGAQMVEGMRTHLGLSQADAWAEGLRLLDAVRISDAANRMRQYPHELSGGMCQRVMLAIALSCRPRLLIADEPTTALDVTVQAQLLDLIREQSRARGLSMLLISHDLAVVATMCERVAVMRQGQLIEQGDTQALMSAPQHPYTRALLAAAEVR